MLPLSHVFHVEEEEEKEVTRIKLLGATQKTKGA